MVYKKTFNGSATVITFAVTIIVLLINWLYIGCIGTTDSFEELKLLGTTFDLMPWNNPRIIIFNILGIVAISVLVIILLEKRLNINYRRRKDTFDFSVIFSLLFAFIVGIIGLCLMHEDVMKSVLIYGLITGVFLGLAVGIIFILKGTLRVGNKALSLGSGILPSMVFSIFYGVIISIKGGFWQGLIVGLIIASIVYLKLWLYKIIIKFYNNDK